MAVNAGQQYCLRWNNHLPNFLSMFSRLLGTEALVDVTLAAGGRTIQAHRIVLAACSSYFEEIFQANPCQHPVVILKDIGFEDLRAIVEFMYYGEVHVSQANLQTVIQAADTLRVKGLTDPPTNPHTFTSATKRNANLTTANRPPSPRRRKKSRRLSADASLSTEKSEEATTSLESRETDPSSGVLNSMLSQQSSLGEEESFNAAIIATETVVEGESGVETSSQPSNEASLARNSATSKTKRMRPLTRQECVKKEHLEHVTESEPASPTGSTVLTKSLSTLSAPPSFGERQQSTPSPTPPAATVLESLQPAKKESSLPMSNEDVRPRAQTFLEVPVSHSHITTGLTRQRSQPILPSQTTIVTPGNLPSHIIPIVSTTAGGVYVGKSLTAVPIVKGDSNTSTACGPTIVVDQYPIFRVVSQDEPPTQTTPVLLQRAASAHVELTDSWKSLPVEKKGAGHCPVQRTGPALGCNFCWNTIDSCGRILRRKTRYHCPECQANLCIVPCFQEYHEKFTASAGVAGESKEGNSGSKGQASGVLPKMSSV